MLCRRAHQSSQTAHVIAFCRHFDTRNVHFGAAVFYLSDTEVKKVQKKLKIWRFALTSSVAPQI